MNQSRIGMVVIVALVMALSGVEIVRAAALPELRNQPNDTHGDSMGTNSHVQICSEKQFHLGAIYGESEVVRKHSGTFLDLVARIHEKDLVVFRRELGRALQRKRFDLVVTPAEGCAVLTGTIDHYLTNNYEAPYRAEIVVTDANGLEVCRVVQVIEARGGLHFSKKSLWVDKLVDSVLEGLEKDCPSVGKRSLAEAIAKPLDSFPLP